MDSLKKIALSGSAVLVALLLSLAVMAPTTASAATVTSRADCNVTTGTGGSACSVVLTLTAGEQATVGNTLILSLPQGTTFIGVPTIAVGTTPTTTLAYTVPGVVTTAGACNTANVVTFTVSAVNNAAAVVTVNMVIRYTGNQIAGVGCPGAPTVGAGNGGGSIALTGAGIGANPDVGGLTATYTAPAVVTLATSPVVTSLPADGSQSVGLTTTWTDANGVFIAFRPINWSSSVGIIGTGTAKTALSSTNAVGNTTQSTYRCNSGSASTDTIIVSNTNVSAVATLSINCTTSSGTTASKIVVNAPTVLAVAATITNASPNYTSPTTGTNLSLRVTDSAGLGVNGQVVLVSVDKGTLTAGFGATCPSTAKAVTGTTASLAPSAGGTNEAGTIQLTFCALQTDAPGKATVTAQNVSTTMANATASISMAGRPSKVEATATGNAISAKVSDSGGNAVADGTPVRFTMSTNAGATSTSCTTTSNGAASAVVALIAATGTVIVSADWNENGAAATCAAAGAQQVAASVTVPGGSATSGGTTGGGGTGVLTSGSVPATGFGLIVFSGGTVAQLVTASGVGNTGALYATVGGIFVPYVPGTTIAAVNADFLAAFPGGNIPANTAFVGRK